MKIYQLHEFVSNSADMKTVPHHLTLTEPLIIQAPAESPDPDFPDRRFQPQSWPSPLYVGRGGNAGLHLRISYLRPSSQPWISCDGCACVGALRPCYRKLHEWRGPSLSDCGGTAAAAACSVLPHRRPARLGDGGWWRSTQAI